MPVYLSLGSNVGDRLENLRSAVEALRAEKSVEVVCESRVYETTPVGDVDQADFLNMAVVVMTSLPPHEFLDRTQAIEKKLGRVPTRRWGPRVIDIDIVLWEQLTLQDNCLTIPHPEFRKRAFVLAPLAEIAPYAVDPGSGKSMQELYRELPPNSRVCLYSARTPNPTP